MKPKTVQVQVMPSSSTVAQKKNNYSSMVVQTTKRSSLTGSVASYSKQKSQMKSPITLLPSSAQRASQSLLVSSLSVDLQHADQNSSGGGQPASSGNSARVRFNLDDPTPKEHRPVLKIGSLMLDAIKEDSLPLIDQYVRSLEDELGSKSKLIKVLMSMLEDSQARNTELKEQLKLKQKTFDVASQTDLPCPNCEEHKKSLMYYEFNHNLLRERNKSLEEDLNIVLDRLIADHLSPHISELRSQRHSNDPGRVSFNPQVQVQFFDSNQPLR